MAKQKINANSIAFCNEYVANGYNAVQAYVIAYPKSSLESARGNANRLLRTPEIKEYIKEIQKERFEALNISAERIACELAELAFSDFDDNNTASSKLKALDLLQKQLGLQTQKVDAKVETTTIKVTVEDEEDAIEEIGKAD